MRRELWLMGGAGCRVAQAVLWTALAGLWPGETVITLLETGRTALSAQTEALYAQYARLREILAQAPGGETPPALTISRWPGAAAHASLRDWAGEDADSMLLCRALFDEDTAAAGLDGSLAGHADAAGVLWADLLSLPDNPLAGLPCGEGEKPRVLLGGRLDEGFGAAGLRVLAGALKDSAEVGLLALEPYAGDAEDASACAAAALRQLEREGLTGRMLLLGLTEGDCAGQDENAPSLVEWLSACYAASFFEKEPLPEGAVTFRAAPGRLDWEIFEEKAAAYRRGFGGLMQAAAAFRLEILPVAQRGLAAPNWLRDRAVGWYAAYFRQARQMDAAQREALAEDMRLAGALLEEYRRWMTALLGNLPPQLRSAGAMEKLLASAADNYRQLSEISAQLTVMRREASESGLAQEKTVHRHGLEDHEDERMQRVLAQMEEKRERLAQAGQTLEANLGGAARLRMLRGARAELAREAEKLHAQAEEARRRIDEAARVAQPDEQYKVATARTKLERMERYTALVDARLEMAREDERRAEEDDMRRQPPQLPRESGVPENGLFSARALMLWDSLPDAQEGRREKRRWAEAEAAFAGATLPAADHEEDLAAFLRRLKDMEANGAPAAALVANLLALAREAAA